MDGNVAGGLINEVINNVNGVNRSRRCVARSRARREGQGLTPLPRAAVQKLSRLSKVKPDGKRCRRNYACSYGELRAHRALADGRGNSRYRQLRRVVVQYHHIKVLC